MSKEKVKQFKLLINQFIMKHIPCGFQSKDAIEDWLTKDENQEILQNFLEEKNVEEEKLFDALLAGRGQYLLRSSENNLINEKFSSLENIMGINDRLNKIQEELDGKPTPVEYSNIWLFGVKDDTSHYISTTGIGLYLSFETELEISDYYDSLFKSMVPVPKLPEEDITTEDMERYFNSSPVFNDEIEEKVRVDLKLRFYEIMDEVLKKNVDIITQKDFIFISRKEVDDMGVDIDIVFSNSNIAKNITIESFFDDVENLIKKYSSELTSKQMCKDVISETNEQLKKEFNESYEKFKNNPNLEPLNKHKKPLKIKFA